MHVRIQLIRDDGSVVIDQSGPATGRLVWDATELPLAQVTVTPGVYITAFEYRPEIIYQDPDDVVAEGIAVSEEDVEV